MITLDEYKNYLINFYKYSIDNTFERRKQREIILNKYELFLNRVINDTYDFAKDIFKCQTLNGYACFEIDEDTSFGIDLFLSGGWYSDMLYKDSNGKLISKYILKAIFGKYFSIEIRCDEIEREFEEDVLSFDYHFYLYMQGFSDNMSEIKENLFGEEKTLKKPSNL